MYKRQAGILVRKLAFINDTDLISSDHAIFAFQKMCIRDRSNFTEQTDQLPVYRMDSVHGETFEERWSSLSDQSMADDMAGW